MTQQVDLSAVLAAIGAQTPVHDPDALFETLRADIIYGKYAQTGRMLNFYDASRVICPSSRNISAFAYRLQSLNTEFSPMVQVRCAENQVSLRRFPVQLPVDLAPRVSPAELSGRVAVVYPAPQPVELGGDVGLDVLVLDTKTNEVTFVGHAEKSLFGYATNPDLPRRMLASLRTALDREAETGIAPFNCGFDDVLEKVALRDPNLAGLDELDLDYIIFPESAAFCHFAASSKRMVSAAAYSFYLDVFHSEVSTAVDYVPVSASQIKRNDDGEVLIDCLLTEDKRLSPLQGRVVMADTLTSWFSSATGKQYLAALNSRT